MKAASFLPVAQMTNICLLTGLYFFAPFRSQEGWDVRTEAGSLGPAGIRKDVGQRRRERTLPFLRFRQVFPNYGRLGRTHYITLPNFAWSGFLAMTGVRLQRIHSRVGHE